MAVQLIPFVAGRDGGNIFDKCLAPLLRVRMPESFEAVRNSNIKINPHLKNIKSEEIKYTNDMRSEMLRQWSHLIPAIEERFFMMVNAGKRYGYNTNALIEKPTFLGSTVFEAASLFSKKICKYILDRNIRVNCILHNFIYPVFNWIIFDDKMIEKMLLKGINPKIISGKL